MKFISNIPDGFAPDVRFRFPFPEYLNALPFERIEYRRKLMRDYLRTSVACKLYNLHYFKFITLLEWMEETQKMLVGFAMKRLGEFNE